MRRRRVVFVLVLAAIAASLAASTDARPATSQARVTIFARPTVVAWARWTELYGAARDARPDDVVTIQAKECGSPSFGTYAEAHVGAGGGWSMDAGTGVTTTFRAVWRGSTSTQVTVRQAANVSLERRRTGRGLVVGVTAKRSFWRRTVEIQRRQSGGWRTIRTVRLTDSVRSTGAVSASEARFRLSVPAGTSLRAVLPAAQARPCYVQSVSRTVRT
jgi:hypothetical protein